MDFGGAADILARSECGPEVKSRDMETLELLRRTLTVRRSAWKGFRFSGTAGRWRMEKDGFSIAYDGKTGLECEDDKGRPSKAAGCVRPAEALLRCIERYRFAGQEAVPDKELENALRKAGYIQ
jgi:hypothetical protein